MILVYRTVILGILSPSKETRQSFHSFFPAKLYVENLREGAFVPEDEKFARICKLYQQIPADNVDKTAYLGGSNSKL